MSSEIASEYSPELSTKYIMPRIVSIVLDENIDPKIFASKIVPIIEKEIEDPNVQLIFPPKPSMLWRYLKTRKFTNAVIYCTPAENESFQRLSNFKPSNWDVLPFKKEITPDALFNLKQCDLMIKYDREYDIVLRIENN